MSVLPVELIRRENGDQMWFSSDMLDVTQRATAEHFPTARKKAEDFAQVVRAAPDLLDACEALLELHEAMGKGESRAARVARAAIVKAKR